jgi:flavin reductase (DIM6/NTAB) family NADH-FMN oxidoreductase RutF
VPNASAGRDEPRHASYGDPKWVGVELFRDVIGRFASGVAVVSARVEGVDHLALAGALSSLSMSPPMLLVCLDRDSETSSAIVAARRFAIDVLAETQAYLAQLLDPGPQRPAAEPIAGSRSAARELSGSLAHFECRVAETARGGTHTVFLADVERAVAREGRPLTRFRGDFGGFSGPPG